MNYGDVLKSIRKQLGLTQVELAEKIDWPLSTIGECETTTRVPSARKHHQLEKFLKSNQINIDWDNVFDEKNNN